VRINLNILHILDSDNGRFSPFRVKGNALAVNAEDGSIHERECVVGWKVIDLDDGDGKFVTNTLSGGKECCLIVNELNREHKMYSREIMNYLFDGKEIILSL